MALEGADSTPARLAHAVHKATMNPRIPAAALSLVLAMTAGCSKPPLDSPVTARDYLSYSMWRSEVDPALTDVQRKEIGEAESEIKLGLQITSGAGRIRRHRLGFL